MKNNTTKTIKIVSKILEFGWSLWNLSCSLWKYDLKSGLVLADFLDAADREAAAFLVFFDFGRAGILPF